MIPNNPLEIKNPKITNDSIRAKPMIIGTNKPAEGLRAMPSNAEAAALDCAKVPPRTAKPIAKPAANAINATFVTPPAAAAVAVASCAKAGIDAMIDTNNNFFM